MVIEFPFHSHSHQRTISSTITINRLFLGVRVVPAVVGEYLLGPAAKSKFINTFPITRHWIINSTTIRGNPQLLLLDPMKNRLENKFPLETDRDSISGPPSR